MHSKLMGLTANVVPVQNLIERSDFLFKIKETALNESLARGFGSRTFAALLERLKEDPRSPPTIFHRLPFYLCLLQLQPNSAEAMDVLMDGVKIDITIEKRDPARQQAHRHADVVYHAVVQVSGVDPRVIATQPVFLLPDFVVKQKGEPYRVDSAHNYRVETEYPVTRFHQGRQLMTAMLVDGRWGGEFFIYDVEHQLNDEQCIRSVKAALARAVLSAITPRVRCEIWRPDKYEEGAWRVKLTLGPAVLDFWGDNRLVFDIPDLPGRIFHTKAPYLFGSVHRGEFIEDCWQADLYTNGMPEDENPTTIPEVKAALYAGVYKSLRRGGFEA